MAEKGFTGEVAKLMGIGRARALNTFRRHLESQRKSKLPDDLNENDFRCDAEQVELTPQNKVIKSPSSDHTITG